MQCYCQALGDQLYQSRVVIFFFDHEGVSKADYVVFKYSPFFDNAL